MGNSAEVAPVSKAPQPENPKVSMHAVEIVQAAEPEEDQMDDGPEEWVHEPTEPVADRREVEIQTVDEQSDDDTDDELVVHLNAMGLKSDPSG